MLYLMENPKLVWNQSKEEKVISPPYISFYITEFIISRSLFTVLIFKGAGELNFIIMEAASCSLELCEDLKAREKELKAKEANVKG
ncbi:hypothetical protein ES288_A12G080200v1 [Gossypium darwinii]|nr:hypothetical protein ES288_A12G080200v1 [Gossypium darwinii]